MHNEFGRIWEEVVMAYFKVLSCLMTAGLEEYYKGAVTVPIIWTEI